MENGAAELDVAKMNPGLYQNARECEILPNLAIGRHKPSA